MMGQAGSGETGADKPDPLAEQLHIPVLLEAVLAALNPRDGGIYVDGTFGAGGYARAILAAADTRVIAIDRDPAALARGQDLVKVSSDRLILIEGCFADMGKIVADQGHAVVDGVALDVGVSSMQIDEAARGFSFAKDGPLDMRMGASGPTAADVVNTMEEADLATVIYRLGEERHSRAVARAIVRRRDTRPFERTTDLADIVRRSLGGRPGRIHPATRTFQALRIYLNAELEQLAMGLGAAERLLKPGGQLAVVTFHSLEDRIAKQFVRGRCGLGAGASRHRPQIEAGPAASFTCPARSAKKPGDDEVAANPRARSARLRVAVRTAAPAWPMDMEAIGVPVVKAAFTGWA